LKYNTKFYENRHNEQAIYTANKIVGILKEICPDADSIVDIGCGVGTWLLAAKEQQIENIFGIDGDWVSDEHLVIPKKQFRRQNLNESFNLDTQYDLAICLEVAEHIYCDNAAQFIKSITGLSDIILFSAAIPGQGGINHFNEQWPDYWIDLFKKENYVGFDLVRKKIWNDDKIPCWYKQNIIVFIAENKIPGLDLKYKAEDVYPLSIVHPELYNRKIYSDISVKEATKVLIKSLIRFLSK
jgi:hypothetical protein